MRVLMTGGGTAGHINPALTIAAAIKETYPDAEILFVGAEGRMETRLVPAAGYPIKTMKVSGFQRKHTVGSTDSGVGFADECHVPDHRIEHRKVACIDISGDLIRSLYYYGNRIGKRTSR